MSAIIFTIVVAIVLPALFLACVGARRIAVTIDRVQRAHWPFDEHDYRGEDRFPAASHEKALDRIAGTAPRGRRRGGKRR